jgi:hypothetical protein
MNIQGWMNVVQVMGVLPDSIVLGAFFVGRKASIGKGNTKRMTSMPTVQNVDRRSSQNKIDIWRLFRVAHPRCFTLQCPDLAHKAAQGL